MITASGARVFPNEKGVPTLEDIGTGLGTLFRFRGQTEQLYTVLCHSLTVAAILPVEYSVDGLLHDAAEAVLGDIPTTWKTAADEARENEIMTRIYTALEREWPLPMNVRTAVNVADQEAKAAEAHVLDSPAKELWPEFSGKVAQVTESYLGFMESMLNPKISAMVFTEAYEYYSKLAKEVKLAPANG